MTRPGGWLIRGCTPQGTTSSGKQLLRFKPGAFAVGAPVLPLVFSFPYRRFNIAYTSGVMWLHALRFLTQVLPGALLCSYGLSTVVWRVNLALSCQALGSDLRSGPAVRSAVARPEWAG